MKRIGRVRVVIEFNNEGLLTNVCRDALQLKSLENDPVEEFLVSGSELPQALDHILIVVTAHRLVFCGRELRSRVLADGFMGRPMTLLAIR
jgi:hypothetical protein